MVNRTMPMNDDICKKMICCGQYISEVYISKTVRDATIAYKNFFVVNFMSLTETVGHQERKTYA